MRPLNARKPEPGGELWRAGKALPVSAELRVQRERGHRVDAVKAAQPGDRWPPALLRRELREPLGQCGLPCADRAPSGLRTRNPRESSTGRPCRQDRPGCTADWTFRRAGLRGRLSAARWLGGITDARWPGAVWCAQSCVLAPEDGVDDGRPRSWFIAEPGRSRQACSHLRVSAG